MIFRQQIQNLLLQNIVIAVRSNQTVPSKSLTIWGSMIIMTRKAARPSTINASSTISAIMIFCVGYNFSLAKGNRKAIFRVSALHLGWTVCFGLVIQLILLLIPNVDSMTRWAVLMYTTLPASYLAPSLGRSEDDFTLASGVCSILTAFSLLVFCIIAIIVA